jgi:DNA modification methylase
VFAGPASPGEGGQVRWALDEYESLESKEFLKACARILAPDGSLWVLVEDEHAADLCVLCRKMRWHCRAWVKVHERHRLSRPDYFDRSSSHLLYWVRDPAKFVFDTQALKGFSAALLEDVWDMKRVRESPVQPGDPAAQLSVELLTAVILCASRPGNLVIDPFCGFATAEAAVRSGRDFLGIEPDETAAGRARQQLETLFPVP